MIVLAVDPGSEQSAFVLYDAEKNIIPTMGLKENEILVNILESCEVHEKKHTHVVIEYPAPRGQPMYTQLVKTIWWIGRFEQAMGIDAHHMDRKDVKMTLCGSTRAKDANVRAALISRFKASGGGKTPEIGTKSNPGPLYGVKKDIWAALAVAITFADPEYQRRVYA